MIQGSYLCIPVVTAFIGWMTNVVAVKMLFHPRRPFRILGMTIQGAIPRRQEALASSIAEIFERELLPASELGQRFQELDVEQDLSAMLDERLHAFLDGVAEKMPMVKMFLSDSLKETIQSELKQEIVKALPSIKQKLGEQVGEKIDLRAVVEEKVTAFSLDKLEEIVMHVATKELKTIERLGGVLGFLIGLGQLAVMLVV